MDKLILNLNEAQKNTTNNIIKRVPKNEDELKRIFFKIEELLGFEDVRLYMTYPDASAFYNGKEINIEFEYNSSNFKKHEHDENFCDIVICWEHDDDSLKIQVLEISTLSENWLDLRKKAIQEYYMLNMGINLNGKYKNLNSRVKRMNELMDIYNFDREDAMAYYMGMKKSSLKYYSHLIGEYPECMGGDLVCVKKDIEPINLGIDLNSDKAIPVVLCKNCENNDNCILGKKQQIGYFFIFSYDEERPRRVNILKFTIKNVKCLSHCTEPPNNVWKIIQFKRI